MNQITEGQVQKVLDRGLTEPSDSPWALPVILVKKKDGTTQICVHFHFVMVFLSLYFMELSWIAHVKFVRRVFLH